MLKIKYIIYALLTKLVWSRWLDIDQFLFLCVFMDGHKVKTYAKKGTRQISSYLDQQTWSIEDSLLSKKNFTLIRIKNDFFFF